MIQRKLLAASVLALAACSTADGAGSGRVTWRAVTDTLGDTVTVRTLAGSVWADTMLMTPEVTVGVFEGADEYMFGEIRAFVVSRAGDIYILDRQVPVVRQYASDGTHVRDVGRKGGGPGEYERPAALALLPDGRLLVRDPGNARINVYDPAGESLTSWRLPSGGTFNTSRPMYVGRAGHSYTMVLLETGLAPWDWTYGLAHFTPEGEHTDTLRVPRWEYTPQQVTAQREGSSSSTSVPFTPQVEWTFSPLGYFVGGVSTEYRIDLFRTDAPILRIERESTPAPVLPEEKAERERAIIENFKRNYGSWRWNGPRIPDTKTPFSDLSVDEQGRIWVQVPQRAHAYRTEAEAREEEARTGEPQGRFRERAVFDVFEPSGRFLGTVRAPDGLRTSPALAARGDTVWAVTRDELDVARLVRFRLVPGSDREAR